MTRAALIVLSLAVTAHGSEPVTDDPEVDQILRDASTTWYDLPPAYQDAGALPGVHDPSYNVAGSRLDPVGNANREFPWRHTGGTDAVANLRVRRFVRFPGRLAIRYYRTRRGSFRWVFPVGTIFGEQLLVTDGKTAYPIELRMRIREPDAWGVRVFRQFPRRSDLVYELIRIGDYQSAKACVGMPIAQYRMSGHGVTLEGRLQRLPRMRLRTRLRLLRMPLREATGVEYDATCDGAMSDEYLSHSPRGYLGPLAGNERNACMRCHKDVGRRAKDIDPARHWYGDIRGSDGIFSWHPFARSSISHNGTPRPVRFRRGILP